MVNRQFGGLFPICSGDFCVWRPVLFYASPFPVLVLLRVFKTIIKIQKHKWKPKPHPSSFLLSSSLIFSFFIPLWCLFIYLIFLHRATGPFFEAAPNDTVDSYALQLLQLALASLPDEMDCFTALKVAVKFKVMQTLSFNTTTFFLD